MDTAYIQATDIALDTLQNNIFVPQPIASFIRAIIDIQRSTPLSPLSLPPSTVDEERFSNGTPLYTPQEFIYDKEASATIFGKLLALLHQDSTHNVTAEAIKTAIEDGQFRLDDAFTAFTHAKEDFFIEWNTKRNILSNTLVFLVQSSLIPSLETCARSITEHHSFELWNEQYCPCCGSDPFLAYWLDSVGKQYNICSFCHTEYRVARMQCTYCGEKNHDVLRYIAAEEIPQLHIQTCSTCHSYIKILDRKGQSLPRTPALDDVNSLIIDAVAVEQGFSRPVLSAFGF